MNIQRQQIVKLMRDLANMIEQGDKRVAVAVSFVHGKDLNESSSGHFISHVEAMPLQRLMLRGQIGRMGALDEQLERGYALASSQAAPTGSAGRLLN